MRVSKTMARALTALITAVSLPGCGEHRERPVPEHLILVTIDTLRRDYLGTYGFESEITPNLDRLAERGVRFEDALSQAVWTTPSHASILTGLNPQRHGVRRLQGEALSSDNMTLAEVLRDAGFVTGAFVSGVPLRRATGLAQGFSIYEDSFQPAARERRAEDTNDAIRKWLNRRPEGRVFLWVHYFDPHTFYNAPLKYREAFGVGAITSGQITPGFNANPETGSPREIEPEVVERMHKLYAAEVRYVDAAVGALLNMLDEHGLLEESAIAVVSDHGECLGERGYFFGHWEVFDETARVPMILVHPGEEWEGVTVTVPVGAIDLMPTLLAWLRVAPPAEMDGIDLTPLIEGEAAPARVLYTEFGPLARAVRDAKWALIERPRADSPILEARFDDAATEADLSEAHAARDRLSSALAALESTTSVRKPSTVEVPERVREQLEILGYTE
jgi:arylsulfatase A-like enzyme